MQIRDIFSSQAKMEKKIDTMMRGVIDERVSAILKSEQLFSENMGGTNIPISSDKLFDFQTRRTRKFKKYLTEKRTRTSSVSVNNVRVIRSPYRYDRIEAYYNRESYFSRSVTRQFETMMRNGYGFVTENSDLKPIVLKEMNRMQLWSEIPIHQTIAKMAESLLKNGIIVTEKIRGTVPNPYKKSLSDNYKGIKRFRIVNPTMIGLYVNKDNEILGINDRSLSAIARKKKISFRTGFNTYGIPIKDLAVGFIINPGDDFFPQPPCFQMLDDILTLRSLEETVELFVYQYGSPLLHARVGSDTMPARGNEEVAEVHNAIVAMAPNGFVTTNHRVNLSVINVQKGIANITPHIEYFKNRVLIGSGSSPVSIGEGDTANRATSESIDDALADHCTYLANIICDMFTYNIIPDILTSAGIPEQELISPSGEMAIRMEFNEMRLDRQISRENHIINLWNANLIKHDDAMRALKRTPITTKDRSQLRFMMIPSGTGDSNAALIKTQNQPSNQYGTKPGPGSRKN